jgi:hypothetical protein
MALDIVLKNRKTKSTAKHPIRSSAATTKPKRPDELVPLIIVPAALTSLLTLYNIKDFLESNRFKTTEQVRQQGVAKESPVILKHRHPRVSRLGVLDRSIEVYSIVSIS